ncbi:PepSY domain-containing protein [Nonomuraea sp. NN258]|uniref:PepSY domain-containing protein n=1 Tax=Nonomuraea antri TaxID=2730852 RepID=UPI0015686B1D|nr:PepSY domain-containing protein [Nonomuraea antri]NRQ34265.1 PepSY domain-containing protein [Nonomuraea antri]
MRINKKFLAAGAGAVVLVAGGGAAYAATAAPAPAPKVTAEQAIEIAHREVPGAWVRGVEHDRRGTRPDVWEVELVKSGTEHELDIDSASGKLLDHDQHADDDDKHDGKHDDHDDD